MCIRDRGSALVRGALRVPSSLVMLMARKLHGQRAPAARRRRRCAGLCRRLAYGQPLALGLGA
eukprot:15032738-Alexandrium_andersonii.AAC.1